MFVGLGRCSGRLEECLGELEMLGKAGGMPGRVERIVGKTGGMPGRVESMLGKTGGMPGRVERMLGKTGGMPGMLRTTGEYRRRCSGRLGNTRRRCSNA